MGSVLSRRAMLSGMGGVAIGLPFLEAMQPRIARAEPGPSRYVVCFGCFSMAASLGGNNGMGGEPHVLATFAPSIAGFDYDLTPPLASLGDLGVQTDVSVVTGLKIPWKSGSVIPPAGREIAFHPNTASPQFSGTKATSQGGQDSNAVCNGPTSDQLVAKTIGQTTTFSSLQYGVQPKFYTGNGPDNYRDTMSWTTDASGNPVPITSTTSPAVAFKSLFGNFVPADPGDAKKQDFIRRSRKSVLDLVRDDTQRLMTRLGPADRQRLERHLEEILALEKRIDAIAPPQTGACMKPADPGADPAVNDGIGYSGEEERAGVMVDLIHMAFTCNLTRVATLMLSDLQSSLNMSSLVGINDGVHNLGHVGDDASVSKVIGWHVKHFASLVAKLKATAEGTGSLLDSCALVLLGEGGFGADPESGAATSNHSSENMSALIAGGAGGLKQGQHVVATGKHPASVVLTAMEAVGWQGGLGEVSETLPELLTPSAG